MKPKRPMDHCYHEAGHALARWLFGYRLEQPITKTHGKYQSLWCEAYCEHVEGGRFCTHEETGFADLQGLAEGRDIISPTDFQITLDDIPGDAWRAFGESRAVRLQQALIDLHAGPYAQAHYAGKASDAFMLFHADCDERAVRALLEAADLYQCQRKSLLIESRALADALVTSPMGSAAIRTTAEAIAVAGMVDRDTIDRLCAEAYGRPMPARGSWDWMWPPTVEQVRAGYMPNQEAVAAP